MKKYTNPLCMNLDDKLINIVTGRVAPDNVNVDDALCIGSPMTAEFSAALPRGILPATEKESYYNRSIEEEYQSGREECV